MKTELVLDICSNWMYGSNPKQRALDLIELGAESLDGNPGAVKFQLFRADKLYRDKDKRKGVYPYELDIDWLPQLKSHAERFGVEFMCTPFYVEAVDILEELGVKRHKIAGWDLTFDPLVERIGNTRKPVIMTVTGATDDEVDHALELLHSTDEQPRRDITLLHGTPEYPTAVGYSNLNDILALAERYMPLRTGFSAHIRELHVIAASVLYPTDLIEIHFNDEARRGIESAHSFTPPEVKRLIGMINDIEKAKDCGCGVSLPEAIGRNTYYRDSGDWLRPPLS